MASVYVTNYSFRYLGPLHHNLQIRGMPRYQYAPLQSHLEVKEIDTGDIHTCSIKAAMAFGVSIGDFIAVGKLIKDIHSALGPGSSEVYRSLIVELNSLQQALYDIEAMNTSSTREAAVNSIKAAALMCQHPLEEFAAKLRKYGSLDDSRSSTSVKLLGTKVKWKFCMEDEVRNLRAYLIGHVGSLNMRLMTEGL